MSTNIILRNIDSVPLHRLDKLKSYSDSEYVKIRVGGETFYASDNVPNVIDFREILEDEADPPFLVFLVVKIDELYKMETQKGWLYSANVTKIDSEFVTELVKVQNEFHEMIMDVGSGGCYLIVDSDTDDEGKQQDVEMMIVSAGGIQSHIHVTQSPIDTMIELSSNWEGVTTV